MGAEEGEERGERKSIHVSICMLHEHMHEPSFRPARRSAHRCFWERAGSCWMELGGGGGALGGTKQTVVGTVSQCFHHSFGRFDLMLIAKQMICFSEANPLVHVPSRGSSLHCIRRMPRSSCFARLFPVYEYAVPHR